MFIKSIVYAILAAAPVLAYEPVTCKANNTQNIVTSITSSDQFCTMLTGYGVYPVGPNEGCGSVYCYGPPSPLGPPMPDGYILSVNYEKTEHYVQVTGCMNSTVWGQNPTDDGGQMDSHGWPFSCKGYKKFVSLLEPSTNTYCLRCCDEDSNADCNTSKSTYGCNYVIPGKYTMADGSTCAPPPHSSGVKSETEKLAEPVHDSVQKDQPAKPSSAVDSKKASNPANKLANTAAASDEVIKTNAGSHLQSSFVAMGLTAAIAAIVSRVL
ncbi:hypothetical protein BGZ76_003491 [Entomortierella beljakovae]|nr:hypothetical protein BGZ76_003491 [Entomortierella beljakovae]